MKLMTQMPTWKFSLLKLKPVLTSFFFLQGRLVSRLEGDASSHPASKDINDEQNFKPICKDGLFHCLLLSFLFFLPLFPSHISCSFFLLNSSSSRASPLNLSQASSRLLCISYVEIAESQWEDEKVKPRNL